MTLLDELIDADSPALTDMVTSYGIRASTNSSDPANPERTRLTAWGRKGTSHGKGGNFTRR